jgi:hypothetical protein
LFLSIAKASAKSRFLAGAFGKIDMFPETCFVKADPSLRSGFRLAARTPPEQLKMYLFAIEVSAGVGYTLAASKGVSCKRSLKKSKWQDSAFSS